MVAKSRVIGLDIGTTHVRAVELEFPGGGAGRGVPVMQRVGAVALPVGAVLDGEVADTSVVGAALRQLWSELRFSRKEVVIGVGSQRVIVRDLDVPAMPLAQIRSTLPYQVQELLPMQVEDALLDFYPTGQYTGEHGPAVQGMLVAATRDTVNASVMAVENAGLRPTMVDLNALALLRAVARGDLARRTVALVDIGAKVTNVIVVAQGVPQFIRMVPSGGQDVTDAVAAALGISAPDAERAKREIGVGFAVAPHLQGAATAISSVTQPLIEAVRNTFVYYSSNHPGAGIELAVLTGGGCHLPGLGQFLSSASRLPVTVGDPTVDLRRGKDLNPARLTGQESTMAIAIGLAFGVAA